MTGRAFIETCEALQLSFSPEQFDLFDRYEALLMEWSERVLLVSRGDIGHLKGRHFVDCLAVLPHLPEGKLMDLGSGGGLPGILIKLGQPGRPVVLVESARMKALFLRRAIDALGLQDIQLAHGRAEEMGGAGGKYAAITARAVADLRKLWKWSRPLLSPGGVLVAFKGPEETTEWAGADRWPGVGGVEVAVAALPGGRQRAFVKVTAGPDGSG